MVHSEIKINITNNFLILLTNISTTFTCRFILVEDKKLLLQLAFLNFQHCATIIKMTKQKVYEKSKRKLNKTILNKSYINKIFKH